LQVLAKAAFSFGDIFTTRSGRDMWGK
jgi:hypothetical protein